MQSRAASRSPRYATTGAAIGTFLVRDYVAGAIPETSAWVMILLGLLRQISPEQAVGLNEARNLARARTADRIFVLSCYRHGF